MKTALITAALAVLSLTACGGSELDDATGSSADVGQLRQEAKSGGSTTTSSTSTTTKKGPSTSTTAAVTYAARTTDSHSAGVTPIWLDAFSASSTYDIYFDAEITGALAGHHSASFEARMPDGTVYVRYDVAFATDVTASFYEQQAEKTSTGYRVWADMPVAGTLIQQANLVGSWRVDVFVDGASTPTASKLFNLQ